ncbi:hypothetical protein BS47DRAFT_1339224, partial [Hydnum rufescens UP504]
VEGKHCLVREYSGLRNLMGVLSDAHDAGMLIVPHLTGKRGHPRQYSCSFSS